MLNQLCLKEGDMVTMENVTLKQATFSKFQPQTVDFLDITDPKAVYPRANFVVVLWVTYNIHEHGLCRLSLSHGL